MQMERGRPKALACVRGEGTLCGCVKFYAIPGGSLVVAEVAGLPEEGPGFFAVHIHEGGSCCGEGFPETGGHYDTTGAEHPGHAGDLPPLLSNHGRAYLAVKTCRFTPEEVVGRTVVIHSHPDDFITQPAGNSGRKIACGVIRAV